MLSLVEHERSFINFRTGLHHGCAFKSFEVGDNKNSSNFFQNIFLFSFCTVKLNKYTYFDKQCRPRSDAT